MTDVINRPTSDTTQVADEAELVVAEASASHLDLAAPDRWAIAALSAAAGVIHLVMAPSHLGESALEGAGFLLAAWLQIGFALAIVARPARWVLWLTIATNVGFVAVWVLSRTAGLPWGAHANHPESVSVVDGAAVALEVVLIAVSLLVLTRPGVLAINGGAFAAVVPLAAFGLATAVIASPQARDHAAHSHGDHMAAGDDQGHAAGAATGVDDKGLSLLDNGHQDGSGEVQLDSETQAALTAQLLPTADLVERYPTVAQAEAAGYLRAGPFAPGVGTHYRPGVGFDIDTDGVVDPDDIDDALLIFDGTEPDSTLVGFMFYLGGDETPEGFVGSNDHWHYHENVCMVERPDGQIDVPFLADLAGATEQMCLDIGGEWLDQTGYMVHVWAVPGYESGRGVFSDINPKVTCPDGTYYTIPNDEVGTKLTTCRP